MAVFSKYSPLARLGVVISEAAFLVSILVSLDSY